MSKSRTQRRADRRRAAEAAGRPPQRPSGRPDPADYQLFIEMESSGPGGDVRAAMSRQLGAIREGLKADARPAARALEPLLACIQASIAELPPNPVAFERHWGVGLLDVLPVAEVEPDGTHRLSVKMATSKCNRISEQLRTWAEQRTIWPRGRMELSQDGALAWLRERIAELEITMETHDGRDKELPRDLLDVLRALLNRETHQLTAGGFGAQYGVHFGDLAGAIQLTAPDTAELVLGLSEVRRIAAAIRSQQMSRKLSDDRLRAMMDWAERRFAADRADAEPNGGADLLFTAIHAAAECILMSLDPAAYCRWWGYYPQAVLHCVEADRTPGWVFCLREPGAQETLDGLRRHRARRIDTEAAARGAFGTMATKLADTMAAKLATSRLLDETVRAKVAASAERAKKAAAAEEAERVKAAEDKRLADSRRDVVGTMLAAAIDARVPDLRFQNVYGLTRAQVLFCFEGKAPQLMGLLDRPQEALMWRAATDQRKSAQAEVEACRAADGGRMVPRHGPAADLPKQQPDS